LREHREALALSGLFIDGEKVIEIGMVLAFFEADGSVERDEEARLK
jgi:hypothetical protein